ncbi:MAG: hypothetical protein ABFS39_14960 [Pseudomonadota bacterium]
MKKIILLAALTLSVNMAMAEGGKVRDQSPLYDVNGILIGTVVPVPDACEVVVPQSGKAVYIICDEGDE